MIIKDNKALLDLMIQYLSEAGCEVTPAHDGEEGLAMILKNRPNIVLLDMLMPKKDGFGVLEALTAKGILPDLPVIIISNSGQPVELQRAKEYGIRDYLFKLNFDTEEVSQKINMVMADSRAGNGQLRKKFAVHSATTGKQVRQILAN